MESDRRDKIVEMILLCSQEPLTVGAICKVFSSARDDAVDIKAAEVKEAITEIAKNWQDRALVLSETAGGWQFKTREEYSNFAVATLRERPPRLSRALLEVLSVIAYHQPATRGDIEKIRGVSVFPNHMRFLEECGWIEPDGRREVPGRPMTYVTTRAFLDDLNLASIGDLPALDSLEDGIGDEDDGGGSTLKEDSDPDETSGDGETGQGLVDDTGVEEDK